MAKEKSYPGVPVDGPGSPSAPAGTTPPPFGTPRQAEAGGSLPRVVGQLERAPAGVRRFKVRCGNYQPHKVRYILAQPSDEAGVRACYLKVEGLDRDIERLRKVAGAKSAEVEEPDLIITELAD